MLKILAGDFKEGTLVMVMTQGIIKQKKYITFAEGWSMKPEKLFAEDLLSVDLVTEENKTSIMGKVGWGAVGGLALGPLGLLAGVLGGGNRSKKVVAVALKDGRKALISGKPKDIQELLALGF